MSALRCTKQGGNDRLRVEVKRAAYLQIGEAIRHELEVPQDVPPQVRDLLQQLHNDKGRRPHRASSRLSRRVRAQSSRPDQQPLLWCY